jgi:hypothetical protein
MDHHILFTQPKGPAIWIVFVLVPDGTVSSFPQLEDRPELDQASSGKHTQISMANNADCFTWQGCRALMPPRQSVRVQSTSCYLARRPDRKLQHLAESGQVCIPRPNAIVLPEIDSDRADADLVGNIGNR